MSKSKKLKVGSVYGRWKVIDNKQDNTNQIKCKCLGEELGSIYCSGIIRGVRKRALVSGGSKSCGCKMNDDRSGRSMSHLNVLVGKTLGNITVLKINDIPDNVIRSGKGKGRRTAHCICKCGKKFDTLVQNLKRQPPIQSCGCHNYLPHEIPNTLKEMIGKSKNGCVIQSLKQVKRHKKKKSNCFSTVFVCRCFCNKEFEIVPRTFKQTKELSCGCIPKFITARNPKSSYQDYVKRANKKFSDPFITEQEFYLIIYKPCVYCGFNDSIKGIDRLDNTKGYIKGNMLPCCKQCNKAKYTMNLKDFLIWRNRFAKDILTEHSVKEIANNIFGVQNG